MTIFLLILTLLVVSVLINKLLWKEEITIAEMSINLAVMVVMVIIFLIFWGVSVNYKVADQQILNGKVTNKKIERVHCRHSYPCHCYTTCRKGGCSTHCSTCYVHSYDNDYVILSTIGHFTIKTIDSQGLKVPPRFEEVKHEDAVCNCVSYKNYIRGSDTSIFGTHVEMTKEEKKQIPEYPIKVYDYYKVNRILDLTGTIPGDKLQEYNLLLSDMLKDTGYNKQANAVVVITDKPESFALKLLDSWYGGKKNDTVIVIGMSGEEISYVRIHSWSLHSIFDVKLRDYILEVGKLDMPVIIDKIKLELNEDFIRRSFREFKYLRWQVLPSDTSILIFILLSLSISTGIGYIMSQNNEIVYNPRNRRC